MAYVLGRALRGLTSLQSPQEVPINRILGSQHSSGQRVLIQGSGPRITGRRPTFGPLLTSVSTGGVDSDRSPTLTPLAYPPV